MAHSGSYYWIFLLAVLSTISAQIVSGRTTVQASGDVGGPYLQVPSRRVHMQIQDSSHYQVSATDADDEWDRLVPPQGLSLNVIHADGSEDGPYTVAMVHQLGCLNVIRRDYIARDGPSDKALHCLNYLRQSILCIADTRVEPVSSTEGSGIVNIFGDYICNDWTEIYSEIEGYDK